MELQSVQNYQSLFGMSVNANNILSVNSELNYNHGQMIVLYYKCQLSNPNKPQKVDFNKEDKCFLHIYYNNKKYSETILKNFRSGLLFQMSLKNP